MRITAFVTNTRTGQLADLELRHRRRARCEDRIRNAKDAGLNNLPLKSFAANRIWCAFVPLAAARPARARRPPLETQDPGVPTLHDPRDPGPHRARSPPAPGRPRAVLLTRTGRSRTFGSARAGLTPGTDRPDRPHRAHHARANPEEASRRRPGLLRTPRHLRRPHRSDERPPGASPRLRSRVPQPHQPHRQKPARGRRLPTPTAPCIAMSPERSRQDRFSGQ